MLIALIVKNMLIVSGELFNENLRIMKYLVKVLVVVFFFIGAGYLVAKAVLSNKRADIIPAPVEYVQGFGKFDLNGKVCSGASELLQDYISGFTSLGWSFGEDGDVRFVKDTSIVSEGYALEVTRGSLNVRYSDYSGAFYALQSLLQLADDKGRVAVCKINDYPEYKWRGAMLDLSRHFYGYDFVIKQIDAMAALKLNKLHLHLTDAAGWRIEIDKYPKLTSFAAWRTGTTWKEWWFGDKKYLDEGTPGAYGGYLTKDQAREIVKYAAQRGIEVVPEIEMPAHSEETLTAYPEYSCTGEMYVHPDFCVGKEATFRFLEDILTEVMEIFPSQYIHIGGDEAGKQAWKTCPDCLKRAKVLGLENTDDLQAYMIKRISAFLESKGRRAVGWDEILVGGAPEGAAIMVWRGLENVDEAISQGNEIILTPGAYCYFDTYQDAPGLLPEAMGGYLPLSKVYSYEIPDNDKIVGVQGNLWVEYVSTAEHAEMMIYPRLFAIAELGWGTDNKADYEEFRGRSLRLAEQMKMRGYNVFDLANEYGQRKEYLEPVEHLAIGKKVIYNAAYYPGYTAGGDSALVDGARGGWTYHDARWQGFIRRDRLDVVVDMGEVTEFSQVYADFMQICGPDVYHPAQVIISVSDDNEQYTELLNESYEVVRDSGITFKTVAWNGSAKARYIRYQARAGQFGGFIFTDEIVVK